MRKLPGIQICDGPTDRQKIASKTNKKMSYHMILWVFIDHYQSHSIHKKFQLITQTKGYQKMVWISNFPLLVCFFLFFVFFLPFFSQSWTLWQLFFLNSFCLNIKHIFFCHSMNNYLRDIPLHFRVNGWILSREIKFFLERINSRTPPNWFLTHT